MFDLHMHTTLSDGELTVDELLERLRVNNIKCFSITDHNHALAYDHIDDTNMTMIKGSEITTSFNGVVIEILGYNIEPKIINDWFKDYYSDEKMIEREIKLFNELVALTKELGYSLPDDLEMKEIIKGESKKTVYYYLQEHVEDFEFKTYKAFFRLGLSHPDSEWFINEARYYPSPETVISLIHNAGGIAFLAHPYEYGFDDLNVVFDYLIDLGLDGIECFHPTASMMHSIELAKYCTEHNLFGSGGSDFHRDTRFIPHGVNAHPDIMTLKCFDWLRGKCQ